MASGTSVVGMQLLADGIEGTGTSFYLETSATGGQPPLRVGYLWIESYDGTASDYSAVIYAGPIYTPGNYRELTVGGFDAGTRYRAWADWDVAGLEWDFSL